MGAPSLVNYAAMDGRFLILALRDERTKLYAFLITVSAMLFGASS